MASTVSKLITGSKSLVGLMSRAKETLYHSPVIHNAPSSYGINLHYEQGHAPIIKIHKDAVSQFNFSRPDIRTQILKPIKIDPKKTTIMSVAGDSQFFDLDGSNIYLEIIRALAKNSNLAFLFGSTGRIGEGLVDVNGGITKVNEELNHTIPCLAQIVDQTAFDAIEKWKCITTSPDKLKGIIYVHGDAKTNTVFGDDIGLEGQFNTALLDQALLSKIREQGNLPPVISSIVSNRESNQLNEIERQQLMYFAVEKRLDLTDRLDLKEVLNGGIADSILLVSGAAQALWQATIHAVLGNNIRAIGGLRGPTNPKTTIEVPVKDASGKDMMKKEFRDFLDTSEFFGYLAYSKETSPNRGFFELSDKYFNGNEPHSYTLMRLLSGIRWVYNPGNDDIARRDEERGGLNSKARMATYSLFTLGCLGGFKHQLDPGKITCDILTSDRQQVLRYSDAAKRGLAPTFEKPYAGKYHTHPVEKRSSVPASELGSAQLSPTKPAIVSKL